MAGPGNPTPTASRRFLLLVLVAVLAAVLLLVGSNALSSPQQPAAATQASGGTGAPSASAPAATATPAGPITVIDHVVVVMQENRSFDSYFGQLHDQGQPAASGLPAGASNPNPVDPGAAPIAAFHQQQYCVVDLNHDWDAAHQAWDGGKMDGFTAASALAANPTGSRTMGYYDAADLTYYYALANTFATGDRDFSSVLAGTIPNRLYLYAATSFGHVQNDSSPPGGWTQPTIFNRLDAAHVSWKVYYSEYAFARHFAYVLDHAAGHMVPIAEYYADAAAGTLPQVSFVDPIWNGPIKQQNSEHPPADIQVGQAYVARVIGSLTASPNWSSSALFLTYDENGGFYDDVAPPAAPPPDGIAPLYEGARYKGTFDRYGFRVPMIVVSPYARPHFVSHVVNDHTSILAFIERRFDLPPLTQRDAAANPMLEFFDFNHAAFARPPSLPVAAVDGAQLAACASRFPGNLP